MFKLLVLLSLAAFASAGGLYGGLSNYGYGTGLGYGYGLGGYGLGHGGSIVTYAPYATSYANTVKSVYPSYYSSGYYGGGLYPYAKRIQYANPLHKLGYYSPTYLGGYPASYSPYYNGYNNYDYGLGHGYGYGSYGGYGLGGYLGGISAYGHNIYNHY